MPFYNRDPKRDHTFDNHSDSTVQGWGWGFSVNRVYGANDLVRVVEHQIERAWKLGLFRARRGQSTWNSAWGYTYYGCISIMMG